MHIFLRFLCLATVSTISLETATISSESPRLSIFRRRINNPHSFRANAASSTRRLAARAISDRVHRITICAVALPSAFGGGAGWLPVATVYLATPACQTKSHDYEHRTTYDTYSLSVLVLFTSGTLPKRPMRMSFARSAEREDVVENA